jgi:predicted Zn-dependent protease
MDRRSLEKMLESGTDNHLIRYTLGNLLLKEREPEAAAAHLASALEQNPDHSASWKAYGKALAESGKPEQAIAAYEKGIAVAESRGDIQAAKEMKVFLRRLTNG